DVYFLSHVHFPIHGHSHFIITFTLVLAPQAHSDVSAAFVISLSSTTRPSNRCTERTAWRANRWSCVTITIVEPVLWRFSSNSMTASPFLESRLPVGSSARSTDG